MLNAVGQTVHAREISSMAASITTMILKLPV